MDEELKRYLDSNFARVDEKFAAMEHRLEGRIEEIERRLESRIEKVETSLLGAFYGWARQWKSA